MSKPKYRLNGLQIETNDAWALVVAMCAPPAAPGFAPKTREEALSNARLLTAAPELLDALERLVHMAECNTIPGPSTLGQARSALAAARGQEA